MVQDPIYFRFYGGEYIFLQIFLYVIYMPVSTRMFRGTGTYAYGAKRVRYGPRVKRTKAQRRKLRRPATKLYVQRAIARESENKVASIESQATAGTEAPTNANVLNFSPILAAGTSSATRIGNQIKLKKYVVRITLTANYARTTNSPTYCRVVFFRMLDYLTAPTTGDLAYMLQSGATSNGWNAAAGGSEGLINLNQSWNTDKIKVFGVRTCCLWNPMPAGTAGSATFWNNAQNGNYRISANFKIDLSKKMRKNLKFNDAVSNYAVNEGVYCLVLTAQANGNAWITTDYANPILANMAGDMHYEDS